jgi:hypothetical protein
MRQMGRLRVAVASRFNICDTTIITTYTYHLLLFSSKEYPTDHYHNLFLFFFFGSRLRGGYPGSLPPTLAPTVEFPIV